MTVSIHPALILILGSLVLPILSGSKRRFVYLFLPILGFLNLLGIGEDSRLTLSFMEFELVVMRADKLSLLFGYLFHIAAFLGAIFSFRVKDTTQLVTAYMYAGSAIGVVFAGDLITLSVFWELQAITSVFLIWARRRQNSIFCGIRYLLMQIASGLLLIAGIAMQYNQTGSILFERMELHSIASFFLFFAFGIKCAFPFFHTWLVDAYPEATPTGTVFLSAFTTKVAVYALARGFAGTDILVEIGTVMAMFPIFYAVIENDLRRVLGYSMINQIGFMVVGIGIGTPMALNGAVAHAFNDVIFKGLLFMSMGAVLFRTGRINGSDLGGLYKSMPWTTGFCIVGAASISAFPLFSGFVSKSMVMAAVGIEGRLGVWLCLLFASAGVFHHAGIKIPYFAFFAHDSGLRTKEAPLHMLVAMGLAAGICIFIGSFPSVLYNRLPYPVEYVPYTLTHVISQTQLLFFSALAFTVLMLTKVYPPELRSVNIDFDWVYRKGGRLIYGMADLALNRINQLAHRVFVGRLIPFLGNFARQLPLSIPSSIAKPIWWLAKIDERGVSRRMEDLRSYVRTSTMPIGISVYLVVLFLALLFLV